jgi:hypothetical protein
MVGEMLAFFSPSIRSREASEDPGMHSFLPGFVTLCDPIRFVRESCDTTPSCTDTGFSRDSHTPDGPRPSGILLPIICRVLPELRQGMPNPHYDRKRVTQYGPVGIGLQIIVHGSLDMMTAGMYILSSMVE